MRSPSCSSPPQLWKACDRQRRILPRDAYLSMGGVAGALATHADEVLAGLSAPDQKVVRSNFQRLVTPERIRAIVDLTELRDAVPAGRSESGPLHHRPDTDRLVAPAHRADAR